MKRARIWLVGITVFGFAAKFYHGPGREWVQNYAAGLLYEVFWVLLIFILMPRIKNLFWIPVLVFTVTCALEFLQRSHASWLEKIRENFLGRTLIGSDFSWADFPHYLLGCGMGWFLIMRLRRVSETVRRNL